MRHEFDDPLNLANGGIRMILIFAKLNALAEKRKEVWQTIDSLAAQIKMEEGCVDLGFYQNAEDENDFLLLETWEDRKALDDHLRSARFTILLGVRSLLSRPPEIMMHTVSQSSELAAVNPGILGST
jgi:quinol monooxygenase YgiN